MLEFFKKKKGREKRKRKRKNVNNKMTYLAAIIFKVNGLNTSIKG